MALKCCRHRRGNSGIEAAIDLAGLAKHVTVLEFLPDLKADDALLKKLKTLSNVTVITNAQTTGLYGDGKVEKLAYTDRISGKAEEIPISGCFIQVGLVPNTEWLKDSGIELSDRGEILTAGDGSTNVERIFAAGDASDTLFKQIVNAAGSGAYNYLMINE